MPTVIGVGPQMETPMETGDKEGSAAVPQRKYYIDNTFIHVPREGVEMVSPMKDGMSKLHVMGLPPSPFLYLNRWHEYVTCDGPPPPFLP